MSAGGSGILKMVCPKMQDFCPRINMLKGNCLKTILQWIMVCQKVLKSYSNFSMSKINGIFSKKKSSKNINFGDYLCKKHIFSHSIFWTTLFSKTMSNFWRTGAPRILKIQWLRSDPPSSKFHNWTDINM